MKHFGPQRVWKILATCRRPYHTFGLISVIKRFSMDQERGFEVGLWVISACRAFVHVAEQFSSEVTHLWVNPNLLQWTAQHLVVGEDYF